MTTRVKPFFAILAVLLTAALCPGFAFAAQANDSFSSAQRIPTNSITSDSLSSSSDVNWYKFTLYDDGALWLNMRSYNTTATGGWYVKLYNSSNKEIESGLFDLGGVDSQMMATVGLPAGTYYVKVSSHYSSSSIKGVEYYLTPSFMATGAWETEFNDTFASADELDELSDYTGITPSSSDEDWFKFKLDSAGKFVLNVSSETLASTGYWKVELYNSQKELLDEGTYKFGETARQKLMTIGLPAGTYYMRVRTGYGSSIMKGVEYQLERTFTPSSSWETEMNNTFGAADSVKMDSFTYGTTSASSSSDEDWFKFKLGSSGNLNLKMHAAAPCSYGGWRVTLYSSSKTEIAHAEYKFGEAATQTLFKEQLAKGTYYLRIQNRFSASTLHNVVYRFQPTVKKANPMTVKAKAPTVNRSTLKKRAQSFAATKAIYVSSAKGKVTYKKTGGSSAVKVSSSGRFTVKKGTKKGTYRVKVQVTAKGNSTYQPKSTTVTVKVKVK